MKGAESQRIFEAAVAATQNTVSGIMDDYLNRSGKQIWSEKSVYTTDFIDIVSAVFPDARYICLYRDCMDFVHSALEVLHLDPSDQQFGLASYIGRHPDNKERALIEYWVDKASRMMEIERAQREHGIRVRYEDIVQSPTSVLAEMFGHLGLEWGQELTHSVFSSYHSIGPGDHKIRSTDRIKADRIGKGASLSTGAIPCELAEKVNNINRDLGYPVKQH